MALVDMSAVEQRYRAVLAVERGEPKNVVAAQFGVFRQTLHSSLVRYASDGLAGLAPSVEPPETTADRVEVVRADAPRTFGAASAALPQRPEPLTRPFVGRGDRI